MVTSSNIILGNDITRSSKLQYIIAWHNTTFLFEGEHWVKLQNG